MLVGWKSIAAYCGVTHRTLFKWGAVIPLPVIKMHEYKGGPVRCEEQVVDLWVYALNLHRQRIKKAKKALSNVTNKPVK